MALTSVELWELALRGEPVSRVDIEHMLKAETAEDLWLDWKGGKLVAAKNGHGVQKGVAGFANAEGGVLVLGVNGGDAGTGETPWTISSCPQKVGKQTIQEWVAQQLVPLRSSLRPLPRITVLEDGIVLIAVQRSELLVPVVSPGKGPTYFLRFYGSTQEVPGYLLADLVLGRRQRPRLDVRIVDANIGGKSDGALASERQRREWAEQRKQPWPINFALEVHNSGLVWAQDVTCGIVFHGEPFDKRERLRRHDAGPEQRIPTSVQANIGGRHVHPFHLEHVVLERKGDLAPFETLTFGGVSGRTHSMVEAAPAWDKACWAWWHANRPGQGRPAHAFHTGWRVHWLAPLYVLTRNSPPQWFQVDFVFDERGVFLEDESSVQPTDGVPIVDIRAAHRRFDAQEGWIRAVGWGSNPLEPDEE
jgi:hypothetical protein